MKRLEIFQRTMTELLRGIDGVICYFDDILCHTSTMEEQELLLGRVFKRLKEVGLQLHPEMCEYRKSEITFLGHIISKDSVRADDSKIAAMVNMTEPTDVAELRRYLGIVNYLGRYLPHLSSVLRPLNDLLVKETVWMWGPEQAAAFAKVKEMLTTTPTLAYFDPSKPTFVNADTSSYGLGGVLLQEHEEGLRPVAYCSRTLTKAETHYAQTEKECLASVWARERFDRYLVGLETFVLYTDHKPLVSLINSKDLSETPLRCQRMLIRLMRYKPVAEYVPGKNMTVADMLSRNPLKAEDSTQLSEDVDLHVNAITSSWPVSDAKLDQVREETKDINLKTALESTVTGWPTYKQDVMLAARDLFAIRGERSVCNGLLVKGDRIVIPYTLRKVILEWIHDGHMGITKCRERANQSVWWPHVSKDIQDRVATCGHCLEKRPSQTREPVLPSSLPDHCLIVHSRKWAWTCVSLEDCST